MERGIEFAAQGGCHVSPRQDSVTATDWLRRQTRQIEEHTTTSVSEQEASTVTVEAWLQRRGVKYAAATGIPMAMIDTKRSRANQARKDPLVSDSVDRFAQGMRAGRPFPPIVVFSLGNKLVIVDGNNRHEAAVRAKREFIHGIVIDPTTDGDLIQLLTVEANSSHGHTPPVEWRVRQAQGLTQRGFSDNEAAEAAGITPLQLKNARSAAEADGRARKLGIHGFADLSQTHKKDLNVLKADPVFFAAAKLVTTERLNHEQTKALIRDIKAGRSEAEQLAIVAEQAASYELEQATKKAMKKGVSSPKNSLAAGIGLVLKCDPHMLVSQIVTAHDRDTIARRLREAEDAILEIHIAMEKLKDLEE